MLNYIMLIKIKFHFQILLFIIYEVFWIKLNYQSTNITDLKRFICLLRV